MLKTIKHFWHLVRQLSGDDAYERYLKHYAEVHTKESLEPTLSREAYFKKWQESKWEGIRRCC